MDLLNFIRSGSQKLFNKIVIMAVISGIGNAGMLAIVNNVCQMTAKNEHVKFNYFALYLIAFILYIVTNGYALMEACNIIERLLKDLRLRISDKIRKSELLAIDSLGRGELFTKLSQETNRISDVFPYIVNAAQQTIFLIFCLVYLATLSLPALIAMTIVICVGIVIYLRFRKVYEEKLNEGTMKEAELVDFISHIIDGFKEIRINSKKSDSLFDVFTDVVKENENIKIALGGKHVFIMMYANVFVYLLLGIIVFIFPQYIQGYDKVIIKIAAVTLFAINPLSNIVFIFPMMSRCSLGLRNLYEIENKLMEASPTEPVDESVAVNFFKSFKKIYFKNITFNYKDSGGMPSFTVGPVDLTINRGEVLFIVGGNGSGKSTLLKLLTGLYKPDSGSIKVDNIQVTGSNSQGLSELYSCIFTDFHLFDRLYGVLDVEEEKVNNLIDIMQLKDKISFENGRFSNLNLSTGQRKRLALIASLLEDKEIYVFDEWAADQDAHFRKYFYENILKQLKEKGKTVIAVTHDDRYWGLSDRLIKLELGNIDESIDDNYKRSSPGKQNPKNKEPGKK